MLSDPVDHASWHFLERSCRSCTLNMVFACEILKTLDLLSLFFLEIFGSWILRILDPKFSFYRGILEIQDLDFLLLRWDAGGPGSNFLYSREILEI